MAMQMAELLYQAPPNLDREAIRNRAEALLGSGIESPNTKPDAKLCHFFHTKHTMRFKDGKEMPAQTALMGSGKETDPANYAQIIEQSWRCSDAAERVSQAAHSQLITEFMSQGLAPKDRAFLFHGVVQAAIELTEPIAIAFTHSGQIISPEDYLAECDKKPILRPGALNVRFYNISNSDSNDMIMDTRGMEELGLHDLQCHFRNLEVNDVARVLYNTAIYIFENGPVIESGQTVEGVELGSHWACQFEESLLKPKREVLDVNPGAPYAAGNRE